MGTRLIYLIGVLVILQLLSTGVEGRRGRPAVSAVATVFKGYEIVPNVTSTAPELTINVTYTTNEGTVQINPGYYVYTNNITNAPSFILDGVANPKVEYSFLFVTFDPTDVTKSYLNWCVDNLSSDQVNTNGKTPQGYVKYNGTSPGFDEGYIAAYLLLEHSRRQNLCSGGTTVGDRAKFDVKGVLKKDGVTLYAGNAVRVYTDDDYIMMEY